MSNHSPSPSQTFFKGKSSPSWQGLSLNFWITFVANDTDTNSVERGGPHGSYADGKKAGQSLIGKKILPSFNGSTNATKKAAKIYVSVTNYTNRCRNDELSFSWAAFDDNESRSGQKVTAAVLNY